MNSRAKYSYLYYLVIVLMLFSPILQGCRHQHKTKKKLHDMEVVGRWKKVSTEQCTEKYPDLIQFDSNGLYTTTPGHTAVHPIWDVGIYTIRKNGIDISTSYDAVINYKIERKDQQLTFEDPDGCSIEYELL